VGGCEGSLPPILPFLVCHAQTLSHINKIVHTILLIMLLYSQSNISTQLLNLLAKGLLLITVITTLHLIACFLYHLSWSAPYNFPFISLVHRLKSSCITLTLGIVSQQLQTRAKGSNRTPLYQATRKTTPHKHTNLQNRCNTYLLCKSTTSFTNQLLSLIEKIFCGHRGAHNSNMLFHQNPRQHRELPLYHTKSGRTPPHSPATSFTSFHVL
jgi:hypothetical protein